MRNLEQNNLKYMNDKKSNIFTHEDLMTNIWKKLFQTLLKKMISGKEMLQQKIETT